MEYSKELLAKIKNAGALGYPAKKIINCFDVEDPEQFMIDFRDMTSEVYKHYEKGKDMADYEIDMKLFTLARSGDMNAIKKFEIRRNNQLRNEEMRDSNG